MSKYYSRQNTLAEFGWKRTSLFALITILIIVIVFFLAELFLVSFGLGNPTLEPDPFVGFSEIRPLFVLNQEASRYEITPSRMTFFYYDSFPSRKPPNEFRVFCLGGSTVAGRPYGIETSFTTWLQIGLHAADPGREWRTINCGGISYASYRLLPILKEILEYQPDMVIVLTGHNEFLEERTYAHVKHLPAVLSWPYERITRLRSFTLMRRILQELIQMSSGRTPNTGTVLASEVEAILDYRDGLERYHRDEEWRREVFRHFHYNINRMVQETNKAGVPLLLINPGCNLRDCPPFKSEHKDSLPCDEREAWRSLCAEAREYYRSDLSQSIALLENAIAIDDQHAGTFYELGKCYDANGMPERAHAAYQRARDLDVCPLRILEPMNQMILEIARREETPLVDAYHVLSENSRDRIPGNDTYLDHVHPTIRSHQLIANAILEELDRIGIIEMKSDYEELLEETYKTHLDSLDDLYFAKGLATIDRVKAWTSGLSTLEKLSD